MIYRDAEYYIPRFCFDGYCAWDKIRDKIG